MSEEPRNDPKVNHLLRVLDEAEERLRAIPVEPPPRGWPTNMVRADTSERGRVAAYILGLRYVLTTLPIYRTCYDPPMGYIDISDHTQSEPLLTNEPTKGSAPNLMQGAQREEA